MINHQKNKPAAKPSFDRLSPAGLYIHIPFCPQRCSYCDFLLFAHDENKWQPYLEALLGEIADCKASPWAGMSIDTLYFGGGTPSLLSPFSLERILKALNQVFDLQVKEFTIEANPETLTAEKICAYADLGVNRLSLGVQSANPHLLSLLGRQHSSEDVASACSWARKAGIDNINLDFISALPGQSLEDIDRDLHFIESLSPRHVSWYSLIVEDHTFLKYQLDHGQLQALDEELELAMDRKIRQGLKDLGFSRYEISNYAQPGHASIHNLKYWTGRPYLGLGLGAASYLNHKRYTNTRKLQPYLKQRGRGAGIKLLEERTEVDDLFEQIMMGLRKISGIHRLDFIEENGKDPLDLAPLAFRKNQESGNVLVNSRFIRLTEQGLDLQNRVLLDIMEEMEGDE